VTDAAAHGLFRACHGQVASWRLGSRVAGATTKDVRTLVRWGLYGFMFSIPLEYPDRSIPLEVHTITGSLLLLIALVQPGLCFRRPPAAFWWLVLYLWMYIALGMFTEHGPEVAKMFFNYLLVTCLFWVACNLLCHSEISRSALFSFVLGCAVLGVMNVLGVATRVVYSDQTSRSVVFGQDANLLGGNMALGLVILMALTVGGDEKLIRARSLGAGLLALVLAKSLMLAGSRGAILALGAGVIAFTFQTGNMRAFARNLAVALLVSAALGTVVYRSESMMKRYQRTVTTGNMSGREQLFPDAWQMFLERPLLGWGPIDNMYELGLRTAAFQLGKKNADGDSALAARDTHNLVLDVLTSMGVLGGLPLFVCLGVCLGAAWKARGGPRGTTPLALSVVVLMLSMDANWSASKQGWTILAYAAASGATVRIQTRRSNRSDRLTATTRLVLPGAV
jgi:O-antigen ligase